MMADRVSCQVLAFLFLFWFMRKYDFRLQIWYYRLDSVSPRDTARAWCEVHNSKTFIRKYFIFPLIWLRMQEPFLMLFITYWRNWENVKHNFKNTVWIYININQDQWQISSIVLSSFCACTKPTLRVAVIIRRCIAKSMFRFHIAV